MRNRCQIILHFAVERFCLKGNGAGRRTVKDKFAVLWWGYRYGQRWSTIIGVVRICKTERTNHISRITWIENPFRVADSLFPSHTLTLVWRSAPKSYTLAPQSSLCSNDWSWTVTMFPCYLWLSIVMLNTFIWFMAWIVIHKRKNLKDNECHLTETCVFETNSEGWLARRIIVFQSCMFLLHERNNLSLEEFNPLAMSESWWGEGVWHGSGFWNFGWVLNAN